MHHGIVWGTSLSDVIILLSLLSLVAEDFNQAPPYARCIPRRWRRLRILRQIHILQTRVPVMEVLRQFEVCSNAEILAE